MPLHSVTDTLNQIDFRVADENDVAELVTLYHAFYKDSTFPALGMDYSPERAEAWLERVMETGSPVHLIAVEKDSGTIVGSLAYYLDHSTLTAPYAALDKFYVRKDWRLSAVGRTLLSCAIDMARGDGAVAFRAGLSSGVPSSRNVFDRLGFHEAPGSILMERKL